MKASNSYAIHHNNPLIMDDKFFGASHKTLETKKQSTSDCGLLAKIKKIFLKLTGIRNVQANLKQKNNSMNRSYASALNRELLNMKKHTSLSGQLPETQTIYKLYQLQHRMVDSTIGVLQENISGYDLTFLQNLSKKLQAHQFNENRLATHHEILSTNVLKKQLQHIIKNALIEKGMNKNKAYKQSLILYNDGMRTFLNNQKWNVICEKFEHQGQQYKCVHTPAGKMKLGTTDIFSIDYENKGVSSKSTQEQKHAVNLWLSETFATTEKEILLFKGIRHAILSPFGLAENSPERTEGAENRAREVVSAALYTNPKLLAKALDGETVPLRMVSTSLLTASIFSEKKMLEDQMAAWHKIAGERPLVLQIRDENAKLRTVKVNLDIATFNFGVNELSLKLKLGNGNSDGYNANALAKLLGNNLKPDAEPDGWVGEYLQQRPSNAAQVRLLSAQLQAIWQAHAHHSDNNEPYKAAKRIALLTYEIGLTPCWNCKSGKDRTGVLDVELKHGAIIHHQKQELGSPGSKLNPADKQLLEKIYQHSGNLQVQESNTGAPGNKVAKELPIIGLSNGQRIGNQKSWHATKGLSSVV